MAKVLEIDGSYLEGGGQILRNALSLSCILRRPIRVINIRANRPNPGLSNQHLFGLNLLQQITNAHVKGNFIKSTEIEFHPGEIRSGKYTIDTRTAASITLVLQAALPVLLFARSHSELELIGGTNVGMAPQIDFLTEVLLPNLEFFGVRFDLKLLRRGFFPRGGGLCNIVIPPIKAIKAANITKFGKLKEIRGICFVAGNIPAQLAQEIKITAIQKIKQFAQQEIHIEAYKDDRARDNGAGLVVKAISTEGCVVGASALGERKVNARIIGIDAGKDLERYVLESVCVDRHVQDQLIIFITLASGESCISTCKLTDHTKTAMHVAKLLAGVDFQISTQDNGTNVIKCKGVDFLNKNL